MIYALTDPRDGQPRYIGITHQPKARFAGHLGAVWQYQCGRKRVEWIRALAVDGLKPGFRILVRVTGAAEAVRVEMGFIASALRHGLPILNAQRRGGCAVGGRSARELLGRSP